MEFNCIKKSLNDKFVELKSEIEKIEKKTRKLSDNFSVVIIGQQNNGKSSLCNSLIKDWKNNIFSVSDIRETIESKDFFEPISKITYVDTPGFGTYYNKDTTQAQEEWIRANLIIFVHSVKKGEMNDDEIKTLEKIKEILPNIESRIAIACTKTREVSQLEAIEICANVKIQTNDIFSKEIYMCAIDNIDYQEGNLYRDIGLIKISNMDKIISWIDNNRNAKSYYLEILNKKYDEYLLLLNEILHEINIRLESLNLKKYQYKNNLLCCWYNNKDKIRNSWEKCNKFIRW